MVEAETITYFELEEKRIADHKIKLESETQDMLEQLGMKEIKEKSFELYILCKHWLEEN